MSLEQEIALVTGASRGIGQGIALELGKRGAQVLGTATTDKAARSIDDAVLNTNLSSVFHLSKACLRGMMKARRGRIINIASVVGLTGNPGQTNYAAAKAGMLGFTKSLAREVGSRNITVNAVAPGFIDTDMTRALAEDQRNALLVNIPLGRLGEVSDVANTVAFLASQEAGYITGQTVNVNGGMFMA
jgi:3-oxoacyl-[acyl-carrier protein] reductase